MIRFQTLIDNSIKKYLDANNDILSICLQLRQVLSQLAKELENSDDEEIHNWVWIIVACEQNATNWIPSYFKRGMTEMVYAKAYQSQKDLSRISHGNYSDKIKSLAKKSASLFGKITRLS